MRIVVGGTFETLHIGHRELLKKAFEIGDKVVIGITDDDFKDGIEKSFEERKRKVIEFVNRFGKEYRIVKIRDIYGPTLSEDFDAIVVSRETRKNAELINKEREKRGMSPMKIVEIPIILAEDLLPVSSRRVKSGEIDENGRRLKKMIVRIGSKNPSKINAVRKIFSKIFSFEIEYIGDEVDSGVSPQPINDETVVGALNRAKAVMEGADYAVGIEAGIFWEKHLNDFVDRAYCVIIDKYGHVTFGHSGGFTYPSKVIEMVKSGMEIGEAMEKISGIPDIKKKMGAIGYLSRGLITRTEFNAQAVLMAMIPRISADLYLNSD